MPPLRRRATSRAPRGAHWFVFSARYAVSFALVVVVLLGSTTAYAAQGALPGDLLYPVKVSVNEPVELVLAVTPSQKVQAEIRLAKRRVAEAQALDAEGRLDTTTTSRIEESFDRHAARALALNKDLKPKADAAMKEVSSFKTEAPTQAMMAVQTKAPDPSGDTYAEYEDMMEDDDDEVSMSLHEQRKMLKDLRERALKKGRVSDGEDKGEVRGVSDDQRHEEESNDSHRDGSDD